MRSSQTLPRDERDRGAVMAEFAIVLPLLLMLVVAIIQFGFALNTQISIQAAAREGARAAAVGKDGQTAAENAAGPAQSKITSIAAGTCSKAGDPVKVTVNAEYKFSIPFVTLGTKTMTATAEMRCEAP